MSKLDDAFLWGFGAGVNQEEHRSQIAMKTSENEFMTQIYHRDTRRRENVRFHKNEEKLLNYIESELRFKINTDAIIKRIQKFTGVEIGTHVPIPRGQRDGLGTRREIQFEGNIVLGMYKLRGRGEAVPINLFA